ncbi:MULTISPECIES: sulfurtransferase TusA family protein [unclassified Streptomyces]|uniref:sulfurtransferase TusA family protein n=1 Tax=unclassified Streptomyces TaxID=2593676 RepID=UPI002348EF9D|nr:sulfurtransferase TusA family protein [Streptomyces sp. M92]WCN05344.1 sulfurtransferase TusA family protein [Streptomyces sp. M92]
MKSTHHETPTPGITIDGTGLLRVTLLLRVREEIDGAQPGTVVHVVATDPAAPLDLPAWCHMTGHHYLGRVPNAADEPVYALRIAAGARPTRATAPGTRTIRAADDPLHPAGPARRGGDGAQAGAGGEDTAWTPRAGASPSAMAVRASSARPEPPTAGRPGPTPRHAAVVDVPAPRDN